MTNSKNRQIQQSATVVSLRLFTHPLVIASIGLLLLNDHLLKSLIPSVITGKLSDFAGLLFFPFLLIISFGWLLDKLHVPVRLTAVLAFILTGITFTLIKTSPFFNQLTRDSVATLVGYPVQILLDVTDLVALLSLVPAWFLWRKAEGERPFPFPNRLTFIMLGAASLATLATSPCMPPSIVSRVIIHNNTIYTNPGFEHEINDLTLMHSTDLGIAWQHVSSDAIPGEVFSTLQQKPTMPLVVCEQENDKICYRITGKPLVEESIDGGQTWQTAWQLPLGRHAFVESYLKRQPLGCKATADFGFYDLAVLNHNGQTSIVIASGTEGVLVQDAAGNWQQRAVGDARPTPLRPTDTISFLLTIFWETVFYATAVFIVWVTSSRFAQRKIGIQGGLPTEIQQKILSFKPILASVALFILLLFTFPYISFVALFIGPAVGWQRLMSAMPSQNFIIRHAQGNCFHATLMVIFAWLPFPLWVWGVVPFYSLTFVLSIGLLLYALKSGRSIVSTIQAEV